MPRAHVDEIEIEYETFGSPQDPAVLLVMGLGAQMVLWDTELCERLAARGFYVIRYDNRDVGYSSKQSRRAGPIRVIASLICAVVGRPLRPPYTLSDMAADAVGLLDAIGVASAHVVGSSMGGMIAQVIAIEHPERVRSLTSISSTTGDPSLPAPPNEALARIARPPPTRRKSFIRHTVELQRFLNGSVLPFDEQRAAARSAQVFERSVDIGGGMRQFLAMIAAPSRQAQLERLRVPALIIHGDHDPVSHLDCGRATADAIPDAKLLVVPGMGHDLSPPAWDHLIDGIERLASDASGERSSRASSSAGQRSSSADAPHDRGASGSRRRG
jgi:pimeloyl-ACP methyl ester carboxylesterase